MQSLLRRLESRTGLPAGSLAEADLDSLGEVLVLAGGKTSGTGSVAGATAQGGWGANGALTRSQKIAEIERALPSLGSEGGNSALRAGNTTLRQLQQEDAVAFRDAVAAESDIEGGEHFFSSLPQKGKVMSTAAAAGKGVKPPAAAALTSAPTPEQPPKRTKAPRKEPSEAEAIAQAEAIAAAVAEAEAGATAEAETNRRASAKKRAPSRSRRGIASDPVARMLDQSGVTAMDDVMDAFRRKIQWQHEKELMEADAKRIAKQFEEMDLQTPAGGKRPKGAPKAAKIKASAASPVVPLLDNQTAAYADGADNVAGAADADAAGTQGDAQSRKRLQRRSRRRKTEASAQVEADAELGEIVDVAAVDIAVDSHSSLATSGTTAVANAQSSKEVGALAESEDEWAGSEFVAGDAGWTDLDSEGGSLLPKDPERKLATRGLIAHSDAELSDGIMVGSPADELPQPKTKKERAKAVADAFFAGGVDAVEARVVKENQEATRMLKQQEEEQRKVAWAQLTRDPKLRQQMAKGLLAEQQAGLNNTEGHREAKALLEHASAGASSGSGVGTGLAVAGAAAPSLVLSPLHLRALLWSPADTAALAPGAADQLQQVQEARSAALAVVNKALSAVAESSDALHEPGSAVGSALSPWAKMDQLRGVDLPDEAFQAMIGNRFSMGKEPSFDGSGSLSVSPDAASHMTAIANLRNRSQVIRAIRMVVDAQRQAYAALLPSAAEGSSEPFSAQSAFQLRQALLQTTMSPKSSKGRVKDRLADASATADTDSMPADAALSMELARVAVEAGMTGPSPASGSAISLRGSSQGRRDGTVPTVAGKKPMLVKADDLADVADVIQQRTVAATTRSELASMSVEDLAREALGEHYKEGAPNVIAAARVAAQRAQIDPIATFADQMGVDESELRRELLATPDGLASPGSGLIIPRRIRGGPDGALDASVLRKGDLVADKKRAGMVPSIDAPDSDVDAVIEKTDDAKSEAVKEIMKDLGFPVMKRGDGKLVLLQEGNLRRFGAPLLVKGVTGAAGISPTEVNKSRKQVVKEEKAKRADEVAEFQAIEATGDGDALAKAVLKAVEKEDKDKRARGLIPADDSDEEGGSTPGQFSLVPKGFRSWSEVAAAKASNPRKLARAMAQLEAQNKRKLKEPIKAPSKAAQNPGEGKPLSQRQIRVASNIRRTIESVLGRHVVNDHSLYPGGMSVEIADVEVTADLRTAYVRWMLPFPAMQAAQTADAKTASRGGNGAGLADPVLKDVRGSARGLLASQVQLNMRDRGIARVSLKEAVQAQGFAKATPALLRKAAKRVLMDGDGEPAAADAGGASGGPVLSEDMLAPFMHQLGKIRLTPGQKVERFYGRDGEVAHLAPAMKALADETTKALVRNEGEIRRCVGRELQMQFVPKLEWHRYVLGEKSSFGNTDEAKSREYDSIEEAAEHMLRSGAVRSDVGLMAAIKDAHSRAQSFVKLAAAAATKDDTGRRGRRGSVSLAAAPAAANKRSYADDSDEDDSDLEMVTFSRKVRGYDYTEEDDVDTEEQLIGGPRFGAHGRESRPLSAPPPAPRKKSDDSESPRGRYCR
jgi:ribosome-binding factor A